MAHEKVKPVGHLRAGMAGDRGGPSRRSLLSATGTALATASAGCLNGVLSENARDRPSQVSLSVTTPPADDDPNAVRIARQLVSNLSTAGIDARLVPEGETQLSVNVLLNREFDLVVTDHPRIADPDRLRTLLHSTNAEGKGWQNPFGYSNLDVDGALEAQCRLTGTDRERVVRELIRRVVRDQPFSVVAIPRYYSAARASVAFEAGATTLQQPLDYLSVRPPEDRTELRVLLFDGRVLVNRNPLAVEYRDRGAVVGSIYDPVGRRVAGRVVPWIARHWEWMEEGERPRLRVSLRSDLTFHDGEPLTASDVAFSYRFLADTSLGAAEEPVPAPRFRGRVGLVHGTNVPERNTVVIEFEPCSREVLRRALTVPVLPTHVWTEKSRLRRRFLTQALVWENRQPVGSGPLAFESAEYEQSLTLVRNSDHFLFRDDLQGAARTFADRPAFERVTFEATPSGTAAVELLENGEADAVASPLNDETARQRARSSTGVQFRRDDDWSWYVVGYNARRPHLSNPRFRRVLSRLVDRNHVVEAVLDGEGIPSDVPAMRDRYVPDDLRWNGESTLGPFPGEEGSVDPEAVRELFREIGYRYDDGTLVAG
ncbi:ABC transporter substrate-binding protein [Halobacteriales archaeon QS_8_69_26]|nr:MAG: ABC transporter substrate-binding protein [Halobacteriales archaeon QS_8_69_26]